MPGGQALAYFKHDNLTPQSTLGISIGLKGAGGSASSNSLQGLAGSRDGLAIVIGLE